jgi:N-acetylmuramic acid 6-phosphate etherase
MNDRSHLLTELRLPESMTLDAMSIEEAIDLMNQQDARAVAAVALEKPNVAKAVALVVTAFKDGGRLLYFGAGTSGRLGVLDASECPPTFRTDPEMVQGIIAGGEAAMFRAQEGAEDSAEDGAKAVDARKVSANDVVMGIATGGTTPYVHGALRQAKERGAKTIFFSCVQPLINESMVDVVIRPLTGPEVVTGSTRLKAGTATKLVLNMITTLAMVQFGKVYENLMVDLKASNQKLVDRSIRIIGMVTGLPYEQSAEALKQADGHVKLAIVMSRRKVGPDEGRRLLEGSGGRLRAAIGQSK